MIGGYAVGFHGRPRYTKDLDIWVEATSENAARVLSALRSFGSPTATLTERDLATEGLVYQIGLPPNRIDVLTSVKGLGFQDAWDARVVMTYSDERINVLGKAHLLANKRALGRPQDLLDVDALADREAE